jgi:hypothetical protein
MKAAFSTPPTDLPPMKEESLEEYIERQRIKEIKRMIADSKVYRDNKGKIIGLEKVYQFDPVVDPHFHELGIEIHAKTIIDEEETPKNTVIFKRGKLTSRIACINEAVCNLVPTTAEEWEETGSNYRVESIVSTEEKKYKKLKLSLFDSHFSLRSFVDALVRIGFNNTLLHRLRVRDETGFEPIDFSEKLQNMLIRALIEIAPETTKQLLIFYIDYICREDIQRFEAFFPQYEDIIAANFKAPDVEKLIEELNIPYVWLHMKNTTLLRTIYESTILTPENYKYSIINSNIKTLRMILQASNLSKKHRLMIANRIVNPPTPIRKSDRYALTKILLKTTLGDKSSYIKVLLSKKLTKTGEYKPDFVIINAILSDAKSIRNFLTDSELILLIKIVTEYFKNGFLSETYWLDFSKKIMSITSKTYDKFEYFLDNTPPKLYLKLITIIIEYNISDKIILRIIEILNTLKEDEKGRVTFIIYSFLVYREGNISDTVIKVLIENDLDIKSLYTDYKKQFSEEILWLALKKRVHYEQFFKKQKFTGPQIDYILQNYNTVFLSTLFNNQTLTKEQSMRAYKQSNNLLKKVIIRIKEKIHKMEDIFIISFDTMKDHPISSKIGELYTFKKPQDHIDINYNNSIFSLKFISPSSKEPYSEYIKELEPFFMDLIIFDLPKYLEIRINITEIKIYPELYNFKIYTNITTKFRG